MSLEKKIAHKAGLRQCYGTQTLHRLISYPDQIFCCLGNVSAFTISRTLYRRFSTNLALIKSRCCWMAFIFQVKTASFKSLKPIMNGQYRNCSTIPINSTNLCSIIWTIIFFKAIKHNMSQMLFLDIHIKWCRKKFKKRLSPTKHTLKIFWDN